MKRKRLYVAGPMRNIKAFNFPAFFEAEDLLRPHYVTFNPALEDLKRGFDPRSLEGTEDLKAVGFDIRKAMALDLTWIAKYADGLALLDGWWNSAGVNAEMALANVIGIPARPIYTWLIPFEGK